MKNDTTKTKQLEVKHQQSQKTKCGKRTGSDSVKRQSAAKGQATAELKGKAG